MLSLVCKCCGKEYQTPSKKSLGFCRDCSITLKEYTCVRCNKLFKTKPRLVFQRGEPVCKLCIRSERSLVKYGVKSPMQAKSIAQKSADNRRKNFDREAFNRKVNETKIRHYGSLEQAHAQAEEKRRKTNQQKYNTPFPQKLEETKQKQRETLEDRYGKNWKQHMMNKARSTCMQKYGVENVFSSKDFQDKIKQTNLQKYGCENPHSNLDIQQKIKETCMQKYGGIGFGAPLLRDKYKRKYKYDDLLFDSQWELAFYIYHKDNNIPIQKEPCSFEYTYDEKTYTYFPDFKVNDELIEIKGGHLLNEEGHWCNPYDHSQDEKYEAKYQCALKNNVKILTNVDEYMQYVENKYTKDFLSLFNTTLEFPYLNTDLKETTDLALIQHFHKSIYEASKKGKLSPLQAWQDKNIIKDVALNRLKYVGSCKPSDILQGFSVTRVAPKISVFKPKLAERLIKDYLNEFNEVFDPFSGFSGRMLGAIICNKNYIGQDINEKHVQESNEILKFKKVDNCIVRQQDILNDENKAYECLFTCPPYGGKEHWNENNDEIEKSCDEWIDICLEKYKCKKYLFVVDETEKYKNYIVENLQNKQGLFSNKKEYVVVIGGKE